MRPEVNSNWFEISNRFEMSPCQCTTYCQNNLLCMGSDLLTLLLMFFFGLYCGYTIDKAVSTLFFAIATVLI